jgi:hypothetical protein
MRGKSTRLTVIVLLCLAALPGAALAAEPYRAGAPGIGDRYFPLDGNGGYDVKSYFLDVRYEPATDRLTGVATIKARTTQNLKSFNLDFDGLTLRSATVDGDRAKTKRKDGELTVTPKHRLKARTDFTAVFRYDGVPETLEEFGLSGFIHTDDGALVIGQPHVASTWFPANDHPRDKARFKFRIRVPAGLEAISNGVLVSQRTSGRWSTWTWDAREPMAPYLAMMAIGEFDVRSYEAEDIRYWDAIDSVLMDDIVPELTPRSGSQFLYSGTADTSYKRLTRTIAVPPGGATLQFDVDRDTEEAFDFLFVEALTAAADDWTTLPDANGHTNQEYGACPFGTIEAHPFLTHYLTPHIDEGDPNDPDDDVFFCETVGTSGAWHAISGRSDSWETWSVALENASTTTRQVEVSITFASDFSVQGRGVVIDDIVVSTGEGSTGFEADGNVLDGWVAPLTRPDGSPDNENTWDVATSAPAVPNIGPDILQSFDRQPEITAFLASAFGPYPFSASGGVVDNVFVGFALENQTRPTYSPFFFFGGPADWVVVHELAHQWYGDSLALHRWQHIWLNEGFATYAEWLWSEREGDATAQEIFDSFTLIPKDDSFWELEIGDPGPIALFDFPVYGRGAMTLHALRMEVGDDAFFAILQAWSRTQKDGTVTTREFIRLAERISGQQLDDLFDVWLSSGKPAGLPEPPPEDPMGTQRRTPAAAGSDDLPDAVRSLAERLKDRPRNPFLPAS